MPIKIDRIDSIILRELLSEGRKSFAQIARGHNTTKEIIANHYKRLRKNGVIVGSTIQIGLPYFEHAINVAFFIRTQAEKLEQALPLVSKLPKIASVVPFSVKRTLIATSFLRAIEDLEDIETQLKKLPFAQEVDTRIVTGVRSTPENLSILRAEDENDRSGSSKESISKKVLEKIEIDEMDKSIIEKLAVNGRIPFSKIAKDLNASTDTIIRRYENLRKNFLVKPVIQIDPTKIGYYAFAVINLAFSQDYLQGGLKLLSGIEDVNLIHKTSGRYDAVATLMIRDIEQFTNAQEQIVELPGLTDLDIGIVKMFNVWPPPREIISTF
jgi:Lrp/AsnC family transcriptional regulator for asnA, asnC and gidA